MENVLVVGSLAIDSVKTPYVSYNESPGGSAAYFAVSASFFAKTHILGVIGDDYPSSEIRFFNSRNINIKHIKHIKGKTFRWKVEYDDKLKSPVKMETHPNVFESFTPQLPEELKYTKYVFLANISPRIQLEVLNQLRESRLIAADTAKYWIEKEWDTLKEVIKRSDIMIINEEEASLMTGKVNYIQAAKEILRLGPKAVIIKLGPYGSLLCNGLSYFSAPAYPLEHVHDPTGAGDSFAGGFMGFLAKTNNLSDENLRKALVVGTVMASFAVQEMSYQRLKRLTHQDILVRYREILNLVRVGDLE